MEKTLNIKGLFVNHNIAPVTRENHLQNFQSFLTAAKTGFGISMASAVAEKQP
ncbi:MAG: hypothetical protein H6629_20820 [Calditrichae bacterium]|nr:hypothetical protein [Calditrichia bacterium]